jgi:HK97 family phage prohead protease
MRRSVISGAFEVKALSDDGTFSGYGAVFGNVDFWGDIVAPGAFTKSLEAAKSKGRMPALLWQHNPDSPVGVWEEMREDAKGLYVEGRLLTSDVPKAREAHALLKAGALSGMSIGFLPQVWEWDEKKDVRTLKEIDLWEVSLVTFPANDEARVADVKAVESIETVKDLERYLREAGGMSRSGAKAIMAKARATLLREAEEKAKTDAEMKEIAALLRRNTSLFKPKEG